MLPSEEFPTKPQISAITVLPRRRPDRQMFVELLVNAVQSEHSKRAYARAANEYLDWCEARNLRFFYKPTVQQYRAYLEKRPGISPASVSLYMAAIRKMAYEAADSGSLAPEIAASIGRVKCGPILGRRLGNWLKQEEAQKLLSFPDQSTIKGQRDVVVLGLLLGCGLRRDELARLTFGHIQEREERRVIVDLRGKGNRIRTIPVPAWTDNLVEQWAETVGERRGPVVRRLNKANVIFGEPVTAQAIYNITKEYGALIGRPLLSPHDLRRTFAQLAFLGASPLEQIQLSLGHSSVRTTERYLGIKQNLVDAPGDRLGLISPKKHTPVTASCPE